MRSRRNLLLILLIVLLILLAVFWYRGRENDTAEIEETEQTEVTETTEEETADVETETETEMETADSPTSEETEIPRGSTATEFNLGGISFLYSNDLAQNVIGGKSGANTAYDYFTEGGGGSLESAPDFLDVRLETDNIPGQVGIRTIRDESGTFYAGYDFAQEALTALERDVQTEGGGDERLQAQLRYLDFANGNGRRSLQFEPAVDSNAPLTNERLYYIFEGITADARHYIWFRYPVQVSILGDGPIADASMAEVLSQIDTLAGDQFTPDLAILDAVVATLNATPTDTFAGVESTETAAGSTETETADSTEEEAAEEETADSPTPPPPTGATSTYTVKSGDNLFLIGLAYGLPWTDIAAVNDLADPNDLEIGQTIIIPANAPIAPQAPTTYLVQRGDTLSQIAEFYGLSWDALAAANGIAWPYSIQAGQTLIIPGR